MNLPTPQSPIPTSQAGSQRLKTFFAVVMHDFQAERPDELDASSGDNITIVAQSNFEWFVAKPIGRLGRPGLIPVSFVEVKDPSGSTIPENNVIALMKSGEIPRVEDWKRAMIAYKAASIPLGVLDDTSTPVPNSPFMSSHSSSTPNRSATDGFSSPPSTQQSFRSEQHSYQQQPQTYPIQEQEIDYDPLPFGMLVRARIESFHFENDDYWFRITAIWQPLHPDTFSPSEQQGRITIFRVYEDFYNFQIRILDAFPHEAGRADDPSTESGGSTRILPYMPGPVEQVDNVVSSLRQEELDQYLQQLTMLDQIDAGYILSHELVREFFTPKAGDVQFVAVEDKELYQGSNHSHQEIETGMRKLSVDQRVDPSRRSYGRRSSEDDRPYDNPPPLSRGNSRAEYGNGIRRTDSSASRPSQPGEMSPQSEFLYSALTVQR